MNTSRPCTRAAGSGVAVVPPSASKEECVNVLPVVDLLEACWPSSEEPAVDLCHQAAANGRFAIETAGAGSRVRWARLWW